MRAPSRIAPVVTVAVLLCAAHALAEFGPASSPSASPSPAATAQPTPFQSFGTLPSAPATSSTTPAPAPTPAIPPLEVNLKGRADPDVNGVIVSRNYKGDIAVPYYLEGTIHSLHPPLGGYIVQVFFVGKPPNLGPHIYNALIVRVPGDNMIISIPSPTRAGSHGLEPVPGILGGSGMEPKIMPVIGWVIRIYDTNSKLITVAASEQDFLDSVKTCGDIFDQLIAIYTRPDPPATGPRGTHTPEPSLIPGFPTEPPGQ